MRKFILLSFLPVLFTSLNAQETLYSQLNSFLQNPEIFEIGQETPHATLRSFSFDEEKFFIPDALDKYYLELNGNWKFHWAPTPEAAPSGFFKPDYDLSAWDEIPVPSNWQMEGFGHPKFRNIAHPFASDPPRVPDEYNPTGSYKRFFTIPADWNGKTILLRFEGVHSAFLLWVNGKEVGYNQGGMEPSEFDISSFIGPGPNEIAVQVYRYSDGTYLEDQDMWRLSGIFRDVYLLALPELSIRDYYVTTDFDDDFRDATLSVSLSLKNTGNNADRQYRAEMELLDALGEPVLSFQEEIIPQNQQWIKRDMYESIESPLHWVPEDPHLYNLRIRLLDEKDEILQIVNVPVGFREIEYRGPALYINGREVKLNAVNSHMQHPELGHAMDMETIRRDLILMKQFNINCVRTSHYPPSPEYLFMTDKYGLYVIDETGDEAHATTWISELPEWKEAYLDRMEKMVLRDRNHPSIIMWSAGNETGDGENICALIEEGKKLDPTRPKWMYGGNREDPATFLYHPSEDVIGPRYPLPFELDHYVGRMSGPGHQRPSFMDEYMAATGNGLGGMDEYWEVIRKYPRIIGGAVWDWISPGITMTHLGIPDHSEHNLMVMAEGSPELVKGPEGNAIYLHGHDTRVEFYRHRELDLRTPAFTIDFRIKPGEWNDFPYLVSKGNHQFGFKRDSTYLTFYAEANEKREVSVKLPRNWTDEWHQVTGIYTGEELQLFLNGEKLASEPLSGPIKNRPFPLCIGWNPEWNGMELAGYTAHASFDHFRIFDQAIPVNELLGNRNPSASPLAFLKFERIEKGDGYYSLGMGARSYGLVWPDRKVQPELWQLKKSAQPLSFQFTGDKLSIFKEFGHLDLHTLEFQWELLRDGEVITWGKIDSADVYMKDQDYAEFPFAIEMLADNAGYILRVAASMRDKTQWCPAGFEIAWKEFVLREDKHSYPDKGQHFSGSNLEVNMDNAMIRISNSMFSLALEPLAGGTVLLTDFTDTIRLKGPSPHLWRAPIANDLDRWTVWRGRMFAMTEGMGNDVANGWRSYGLDDLTHTFSEWKIVDISERRVSLEADVLSRGVDYRTVFTSSYRLNVFPDGSLELKTDIECHHRMPDWLPVAGIQFEVDRELEKLSWYGKGPFETYPDRKTGAKTGVWKTYVSDEYQPYLVPQDYGNHADTRWLSLEKNNKQGFKIEGNKPFHFSVHEYSTDNLTRARYPFHLQKNENLILNLDHSVTGVGGNAISVLRKYRVYPGSFSFSHRISLLNP